MRVIVCGSRSWHDRGQIQRRLARLPRGTTIVHGGARGADRHAEAAARTLGLPTEVYPAQWERNGRGAGLIRNVAMASLGADLCLAFWDGKSTGTAHMIGVARDHLIPVEIVEGREP